jgi:myo-inositol 2-dehydrogenase/D-chiro-inositol 1-dehydrogenase
MTVRIGILGCGSIARSAHLPSLIRTPGVSVVALADHDGANVAAAQAIVRGARVHRDYESVLREPDVDAVIIALPPALHADAAIAALEHGKHVYVEKPLATTSKEAARMVAAARRTTLTAMVGFNYRFHPVVQAARARIVAGALGTPIGVRSVFATAAKPIASWKQRRASGGGVLLDLAVHHIDLAHYLLDSTTTDVWADVRSVRTEHDTASLHLRLTSSATVSSMFSLSAIEEDRIEIYGTAGKVTIDRYGSLRAATTGPQARGALGVAVERLVGELAHLPAAVEKRRAPMHDPSFPAAIGAFVRAVRDRSPASPSFGDGLRAAAVIEAAESSVQTGRSVAVTTPPGAASRADGGSV